MADQTNVTITSPRHDVVSDAGGATDGSAGAQVIDLPRRSTAVPLVVDIDGTLLRSDLLIETFLDAVPRGIGHGVGVARALLKGKAALKRMLAEAADLDYATLPYDPAVLDLIRAAKAEGRPVYLASACDRRLADGIADELGHFAGVFASNGSNNLSGRAKAEALVAAFGEHGFDYVGNEAADMPIWSRARRGYGVRLAGSVRRRAKALLPDFEELTGEPATLDVWLKALRVHQYAKNLLVFVPLVTAHRVGAGDLWQALFAFAAFSFCASAVYLLNDMVDLKADRAHPTKCRRPLAAGRIPILSAVWVAAGLLATALMTGAAVSTEFLAVLALYFAVTSAYSLYLKRKLFIDVITLSGLYSIRVLAGAVAIDVAVSEWLMAFSFLFFTALALMKRYVELGLRHARGLEDPANRDYRVSDLGIIAALSAAAGVNAVTVFAIYLSTPTVLALYSEPHILWLISPVLLYWFGRALMLAHRLEMHDDPIVFAIKDRQSWIAAALVAACIVAAT